LNLHIWKEKKPGTVWRAVDQYRILFALIGAYFCSSVPVQFPLLFKDKEIGAV